MADLTTIRVPVPADALMVIGTGGGARTRSVYRDGAATDELVSATGLRCTD